MDNPQYYQPLSHALHAPLVSTSHTSPRQSYAHYVPHQQHPVTNGAGPGHREEEEEEEDDDDDGGEEEHDADHPRQSASSHSSPRVNAAQAQSSSTGATAPNTASADYRQTISQQERTPSASNDDAIEKRKPGRPRGSRNRKPRLSSGSATKAPANSQHPGFYQYPPPPPGTNTPQQNQQFYEFQWRALNLCSEFYNAAEELVKAASPMVIAQCYHMGPSSKIDPLMMIADAKRLCDSLLANPSQLVGQSVPVPTYSSYSSMPPPPPPGAAAAAGPAPTAGSVITNPQTFVMPLNPPVPPPPQPYYPAMYAPPAGSRYPTTPYYYPPPQGATPYYAAPPPAPPAPAISSPATQAAPPAPAPTTAPPPPLIPALAPAPTPQPVPQQASPAAPSPAIPTNTGTISTFSAATGNVAPGGHQGTWSEEETDRLKRLAEQSREMGGGQNKGEIEWDWVIQQWGNSRTRHQILLKATSLGLKESSTRGTKRRRDPEAHTEAAHPPPPPPQQQQQQQQHQQQPQQQQQQHIAPSSAPTSAVSPTRSPMNSTPASINASPAMQPQRPPSQSTNLMPPMRSGAAPIPPPPTTASSLPWPLPTMASASSIIPSPTPPISATGPDARSNSNYYRPRPTQTQSYGAAAAAATNAQRPTSSQSSTQHQYMYRPTGVRRDSGA